MGGMLAQPHVFCLVMGVGIVGRGESVGGFRY